ARTREPPIATLKTLASPLARAQERALARELLEPLLPLARSGALGYASPLVVPVQARIDPARVLDMIENRVISDQPSALRQAALGHVEYDLDSAIGTIGDDRDSASRVLGWLTLWDARPALDPARLENLLELALADARQVPNDEFKLKLLGEIADRWLELGSLE